MKEQDENDRQTPQESIEGGQNAGFDGKRALDDRHDSNVDPLKPQFERSNLQADEEKRQGTPGGAMDPGRRDDRQNNGNSNK